jgi:hypothetical protein
MLILLFHFALIVTFVAGSGSGACSIHLIWPPSDGIVLMCPDSKMVVVYLKVAGNCSEFFPSPFRLQFGLIAYNSGQMRDDRILQQTAASPLTDDRTPVNFRMMRAPVLGGHGLNMWSMSLNFPWQNVHSTHLPDSVVLTVEMHLVTDFSTPVASLKVPSTTLRMRLFGHPSAHFYSVRPRYTSIPGYVCKSTCGNMCSPSTPSQESLLLLRPSESPVCTRINHAFKKTEWMLHSPSWDFKLQHRIPISASTVRASTHAEDFQANHDATAECSNTSDIVAVSVGLPSDSPLQHADIVVQGRGRRRLLSVVAAALTSPFDFLFLKNHHTPFNEARVRRIINKADLQCSYPFIAFHHQRIEISSQNHILADFGSINDGILLSRAAATLIAMAANDQSFLNLTNGPPDPCSEYAVFGDAWLCWCASSLDVPALDIRFGAAPAHSESTGINCVTSSTLFHKLDEQRLWRIPSFQGQPQSHPPSDDDPSSSEVDSATQRFTLFVQHISHLLASEINLHQHLNQINLSTGEYRDEPHFWDACFSHLISHAMKRRDVPNELFNAHPRVLQADTNAFEVFDYQAGHDAIIPNNFVASLPAPMLDNEHLQLVTSSHQTAMSFDRSLQVAASFAWIVSGVWRGQRSLLTLHHLRDVVCAGLGHSHVHFYFIMSNVEDGASAAMTSERRLEIRKLIEDTLPFGSVMLVVFQERVDHSGWLGRTAAGPRFCNFSCAESWCPPLQSAYNYITATETYQFYRYAFVVLSRTDTHYGGPIAPAQRWHDVIPPFGVAGSRWTYVRGKIEWGKDDSFFVLRRFHATAAFLHFPAFALRLIKRESMSSSVADRAEWSYTYCWAEAAMAYFFTASSWSAGSMQVLDLCELALIGSLQTHMNSGLIALNLSRRTSVDSIYADFQGTQAAPQRSSSWLTYT